MADPLDNLKCMVETLSPVSRELDIEVSAAEAAKTHEEMTASFASRAKLPGFRPGKAPLDVVLQKFGHDIEHEVIDQLIPESLHQALEKNGIRAVGVPSVRDVSYRAGEPIRFKAVVETWPEFDLPPYKKLKLKKRDESVSEVEVDKTIADLRLKHAEYLPVENRGIQAGDYVNAQVQGRDLKSKRLLPKEKIAMVAGHEHNDPAVEAHLTGLRVGEETAFEHSYPADFPQKKLAGKSIAFTMKVLSVRETVTPEVNDELAKRMGEESLAVLRDKVRTELQAMKRQNARREASQEAIQAVIDKAAITLPGSVVEEEMEVVLKNIASQMPRRGLTREAVESIRTRAREQAEQNLKEHLVIRKIAQVEGFTVTEEDVDTEIKTIAEANNLPLARVMETFQEEGRREGLKGTLLSRRTVDFLIAQSIME
ncbi:MAG: trigger factor [Candidatus Aminicenantes bacterium]|nr:trigger factor [Candidatus Aminicenantes bacterium]